MTRVTCALCGSVVPAGQFCGACGRMLLVGAAAAPSAGMVPQAAAFGITPGYLPPSRVGPVRRLTAGLPRVSLPSRELSRLLGGVCVVVLAFATAGWLLLERPAHHTVHGVVAVPVTDSVPAQPGSACSSGVGDPAGAGDPVRLRGPAGEVLASTDLGTGTTDGRTCVFRFAAVVPWATSYSVDVGTTTMGHFSFDDLVSHAWAMNLGEAR